jgi:hypothetical protein
MSDNIQSMKYNSPIKLFWEYGKSLMNFEMEKEFMKLAEYFSVNGTVFYGQLWEHVYENCKEELEAAPWHLTSAWLNTLEMIGEPNKFQRRDRPTAVAASSDNKKDVPPPRLISPGKPVTLLGAMLSASGQLGEIEETFKMMDLFAEVIKANPQVLRYLHVPYLLPRALLT